MRYRTLLLFGAPGVGKGTQGKVLGNVPGLVHVPCGDVFRSLPADSKLGRTFRAYSSQGKLVPDHLTIELWKSHIQSLRQAGLFDPKTDVLLLDGIPRSPQQARLLSKEIHVQGVFHLICNNPRVLHERMRRRALREGRFDDASDTIIAQRLAVYEKRTTQTLSFYPNELITKVNADRTPLQILADISQMIDTILNGDPAGSQSVHHG